MPAWHDVQVTAEPAGTISDRTDATARAVIECAADAIVAFSTDRTVMLWNPAAERMFGYSRLDILGRKGGYGITVPVPANTWHSLRIDFKASRFSVSFNGKQLFEVEDSTFTGPGKVGLWTKADSVALFDQITYGQTK